MKVLISGDTHGNFYYIKDLCEVAQRNNINTIIVPGDFGYWEHIQEGVDFLDILNSLLDGFGITLIFADGNHDNTPLLWAKGDRVATHYQVRSNISYRPRGSTWTFGDTRLQFVGGAFSVDADWRRQQMRDGAPDMWWAEETLSDTDVTNASLAASVTNPTGMITHDAPEGAPMNLLSSFKLSPLLESRSRDNRVQLRKVVEAAQPDWLVHGHFHRNVRYYLRLDSGKMVDCYCFTCDIDSQAKNVRDADGEMTEKGRSLFPDSYGLFDV